MKTRTTLALLLSTFALAVTSARAAPAIISYAGHVNVDGQPFTGQGKLKFAFVNGSGQLSYWSNDGASSAGSQPSAHVTTTVTNGNYSVLLGDTSLSGMGAIDAAVFQNHNDAHLRVWFDDGTNGFQLLTPDRRFASVPYVMGNNGTGTANFVSSGSDSNSSSTNSQNHNFGGALGIGYTRMVADGPDSPSTPLVLLAGDSAEIASYIADRAGRLEYAFDAYTVALPRGQDSLLADQKTLIGPGSLRLVAPSGEVNVAIIKVSRASGRDPNKFEGTPAPGSTAPAVAPAIVSVPQTRSVARGGTTTLFVSATGDNLTYQWKKNGTNVPGGTSAGLPLQNATGADAGQYSVSVSNADGNVTSQAITVTVEMPAVPAGVYRINNSDGASGHDVALTGFSIDQTEVTKAFWDEVYTWAIANGYDFSNAGIGESPEHPIHSVNWYDTVKWANALSERDGLVPSYYTDNNCTQLYRTGEVDLTNYNVKWNANGYRLPTETEWEVAARGGLVGSKYAWGESPSTNKANFDQSLHGATLPVGSYPATGYGLYEIGGNLREWVWDWKDSQTYEYDFKETFPDANGNLGLVDEQNSTAVHALAVQGFQPFFGDATTAQSAASNLFTYEVVKTLNLPKPTKVFEVTNELQGTYSSNYGTAYCKIKFYYSDSTTFESSEQTSSGTDYVAKNWPNPNFEKPVTKIEVLFHRSSSASVSRERNTRVYRYASHTNVGYLTLNLPQYHENNSTHFEVKIDATRESGDDIWFELVDGDNSQTYVNADFGNRLSLPVNVKRPKKLRIYLNQATSNSLIGGTFVHAVYWKTNDPQSVWTGTQRVLRDNHYAEGLQDLNKRNFSDPKTRYSTVGFRLVQRP